jgi:hypothetical protein
MTVRDADTIDHITLSEDESTCNLLMVEDRPFTGSSAQNEQIREKMNTYLTFVQTGQLAEQFPELAGKRMAVRLVCHEEPENESVIELLKVAAALFARHGADFSIEVVPREMVQGGRS